MLTTQRLILRPWTEADAEELYRHAKSPEVGPVAGWPPHTSVENSREIIRTVLSAAETYAIVWKETGLPIGSIGLKTGNMTDLTDRADECELGYWVGKAYWNRGIVTEAAEEIIRHAFADLGMEKVWCAYYDGNLRSKRVQEKCGFVYDHTSHGLEVSLLGEIRTGHVNLMTKQAWLARENQ